jgi:hypothetical protein
MGVVGIVYVHLVYFTPIWYIFWSFGIYFVAIWYILWPFGIFCGHLIYFSCFGMLQPEKSGNPDRWLHLQFATQKLLF